MISKHSEREQEGEYQYMNYRKLFNSMHNGFFNEKNIKSMPENLVFTELIMDLRQDTPNQPPYPHPENIIFGEYHCGPEKLKETVGQVNEDWVPYFEQSRTFCAFDRNTIVSFCILGDWGRHDGLHIGGPGCVGTIPEYREKGIGLELVRQATNVLKDEGFDISWIHFTHLGYWYKKLGYRTVLRWNSKGIITA